ncbi:MAG: PEP-CTERM sorting domain-containing protein [Okeania sp. SIO2G4]|nr:PEP-CTERM sorting domain-containing protein [Okeania sp. SIO4D6]NEP71275.1 PEP-CTERM sorting domain-containing protein [Okeania sp. SIO2G5]NEP92182.1 PEP-CTERM sorting domain-containing protein [Okeania sp. SIO2F5]NEQ90218.1 PEP-CTERM sorting domain-containing protein [Okeania sp. SIO2G4]
MEQTVSNFSNPISFDGFDSSVGNLTGVSLDYNFSATGSAFDSAQLCTSIQDCEGSFVLSLLGDGAFAGLSDIDSVFVSNSQVDDGVSVNLSIIDWQVFDTSAFVDVASVGDVVVEFFADGDLGNDSFAGLNLSEVSGEVTLKYEFEEVSKSTPEPTSMLGLLAIGTIGATSLKRKQKEEK